VDDSAMVGAIDVARPFVRGLLAGALKSWHEIGWHQMKLH
jgi:hypothetical protein